MNEGDKAHALEFAQDDGHAFAQTQGLLLHLVAGEQVGPRQQLPQGQQDLAQIDLGGDEAAMPGRDRGLDQIVIALQARQFIQVLGGLFEALVLLKTTHQVSPGVLFLLGGGGAGQQHARLDLGQQGGHHQVFRRQFQAHVLHQLNVFHVLVGDHGNGDVEDVQVLALDQVEQQVQGPLEGVEEDLQGVRRYVEVLGQGEQGLALDDGEGHLPLLGRPGGDEGGFRRLVGCRRQACIVTGRF